MNKENYYNPNRSEKKLIVENKNFSEVAIENAYIASLVSSLLYFKMGENEQSDALRHCLWAALIAKETNLEWAKRWTDAHEDFKENGNLQKEMDLFNNSKGIEILKNELKMNHATIVQTCVDLMKNGQLQIIKNSKKIPSTNEGFNLPSIFDVIEKKVNILLDFLVSFYPEKIQDKDKEMKNALHYCVNCNYIFGLESILKLRVLNIEDSDEFGDSPLIYSITQAKLTCFNLLLTNGVDVNRQRMNDKMTPLMMASMSGQLDMVRLLLAHGANKKLKNLNSFTAKDLAENEGRVEIVKILS
jgi:hypothetical protein